MDNLYNKYRPKTFEDVLGQNVIKILQAQVANNTHLPTYIFSGPSGTGKTTIARIMAMALLCQKRKDGEYDPCGTCLSCRQIINDTNRDVDEINCATEGKVGDIRDIIAEKMIITPSVGDYRIFILDECHMLTKNAQNALLKIMEEPPKYVKFFLCTTSMDNVIDTIKNRCQSYKLNRISESLLITLLQKIVKEECIENDINGITLIAQAANGSPRGAISLLSSIASVGVTEDNARIALSRAPRKISINLLKAILELDRADAYQVIMAAYAEGRDLPAILEECARILVNDVTEAKLLGKEIVDPEIKILAANATGTAVVEIATKMLEINTKIRQNVPAELIVPVGILNVIGKLAKG